jgi:tRNA (guanine37-N1)-methyltransferase
MFRATLLTLFPAMFPGPLGQSLAGEALAKGLWSLEARDIREHGIGRHRAVDDTPAGGGPGMVMRADVIAASLDAAAPPDDPRPRLVMSPRGRPFAHGARGRASSSSARASRGSTNGSSRRAG